MRHATSRHSYGPVYPYLVGVDEPKLVRIPIRQLFRHGVAQSQNEGRLEAFRQATILSVLLVGEYIIHLKSVTRHHEEF